MLKLLSGAAVAATGVAGVNPVAGFDTDRQPNYKDEAETRSEWVLRLAESDEVYANGQKGSAKDVKRTVEEVQAPVLGQLISKEGTQIESTHWLTNAIIVSVDENKVDPEAEFTQFENVAAVHPNFEVDNPEPVEQDSVVAQSHGTTTYGLDQIETTETWEEFGTRGDGARVAVLDTGIDASHPAIDLAENGWAQFDAEGNQLDTEPNDPDGHGTHTSGTVAGGLAEALGAHIGVAPEAELYHGKVLDDGGTFAQILAGMEWAVQNEADVINMSLGADGYFPEYIAPVRNAMAMGTFVVVSSGNSGPGTSGSPGNVYDSFSVGATTAQEGVASFSSGEQVYTTGDFGDAAPDDWPDWFTVPDVSAPGAQVISAQPGGGYAALSGTSMAAPHTAGTAALLASVNSGFGPDELERVLRGETIHPLGEDRGTRYGSGIISAYRSLTTTQYAGEITGTVTGPSGSPLAGVSVESGYGTSDVTDEDGEFSIPHPEETGEVSAQPFGLAAEATGISVEGTTQQDLALESVVDVSLLQGQPPDMAAGSSFDIQLEVANLESLSVALTDATQDVAAEDVTLTVGEQSFSPGESISFSSALTGEATLTVDVASGVPNEAAFSLEHTFGGPGEDITVTTPAQGQTTVLADPAPATFEIVEPNFDPTVGANRVLETRPTIENTGDLTDTQNVTLNLSLAGQSYSFPTPTTLAGGESTQVDLSITFGSFPRIEGTQEITTADDSASSSMVYQDAAHRVQSTSAADSVAAGNPAEIEATIENIGELDLAQQVTLTFAGRSVDAKSVSIASGSTGTVTLSAPTENILPGTYSYTVTDPADNTSTGEVTITEPEVPSVNGNQPTDPDGDGVHEDLNGDGTADVLDVQVLFSNLESETIQNNPSLFDYNGNGEVDISDVQALYAEVSQS
jgi:subtilisin family serine protease